MVPAPRSRDGGGMNVPKTAMVLAAGLGLRMRPLTLDRPKALVEVRGRAMIDHVLDRLAQAGVERAVVNVHAFADQMEAHLATRTDLDIAISDERAGLLDSGGGIKHARSLLGEDPVIVGNIDSIWIEEGVPALQALAEAWDEARMDNLLMLADLTRSLGFDGAGDFFRDAAGRLTPRGASTATPFGYMGFQILRPGLFDPVSEAAFSIWPTWRRLIPQGRLHGTVFDGFWMHVGDPVAREAAEARLRRG
jgi:N-acetyl-alpha-D-muramate 1-phosphate uridylyltransferase